jgi:NAD(P)-dependent dehydrogenase (short-subunit alcohol dehydrogenase family)
MIIISGASKGIGKYLLEKFHSEEKEVIGLYNSTLPETNTEVLHQVNLLEESQIVKFVEENLNQLKDVVLINCAGTNYNSMSHKFDYNEWKKIFDVNTHGTFLLVKHLLPLMREQNYGRIINFSSIVPQIGTMGTAAYAGSKSALWGITKVIAKENATKGITINSLNLGYFNIGMIAEVPEKVLNSIIEMIPKKELGDPINILNAINFLVNSDYITGTSIDINGGLF